MPVDIAADSSPSVPEHQRRVDELVAELRVRTADHEEALQREAAVAEVLQVINSSPGNLEPVFNAMLEKATLLCEADGGVFSTHEGGGLFRWASLRGFPGMAEFPRDLITPHAESGVGRIVRGETIVQILDSAAGAAYDSGNLGRRAIVELGGARTQLCAGLRKDGALLGAFVIWRREVRPFSDRQIALLQNFAAQAVIAMENARLLIEQRESLEQQTAIAEILRVISESPADVSPVLTAVARAALRFCGANDVVITLRDGDHWLGAAHEGPLDSVYGERHPLSRETAPGRAIIESQTVHLPDIAALDPSEFATAQRMGARLGFRASLAAPMLREGVAIGAIVLRRPEPGRFTPRQIELLESFAAQAVIAIENVRLFTETREALEQQTATAEVLQVINSSPGNLGPVFDATLESATRLCDAAFAILWLCDGERFHAAALHGVPERYAEIARVPCLPSPNNPLGRMLRGERLITSLDAADDELYRAGDPVRRALVDLGRAHSFIQVALVKDDVLLGSLTVYRQEVRAFSEKQIALLENFAAQSVIAIENARLINETREALEQQTATAEILRVISQSPTDVRPVFEAVAKAAVRFCGANDAQIALRDGDTWFVAAHQGPIGSVLDTRRSLTRETGPGRAMVDAATVHLPDFEALDPVEFAEARRLGATLGFKAALSTPMLRDGVAIGAVSLRRSEVGAFTDRQIALVEAFASQAVIAIENTRLFAELNHRTADLQESLEYQTAISDVIQVISRSTFDLAPVLQALTESAIRLCEADMGFVCRREGDVHRVVAAAGSTPESARNALTYQQYQHDHLLVADRSSLTGRVVLEKGPVQIADVTTDSEYLLTQASALGGIRSQVGVPLMREESLIGVIILSRQRVQPFTSRQIELLQVFADQAVIAIENTRLLTEQREALEQQTATAEVLQVINASPGDLAPVFDAMLEKAMTLCGAAFGFLTSYDGQRFTPVAMRGVPPLLAKYFTLGMDQPSPGEAHFRILQGEDVIHNLDQKEEEAYRSGLPLRRAVVDLGGARTALVVALRKDGAVLGALTIYRKEVRPFSDKQIALLRNFAAQAVIAIENARLLSELRQRTDDVQESLEYQTATSEVLDVIGRSTSELQPVLDTMLAAALRLCNVQSGGVAVRRRDTLHYIAAAGHTPEFRQFLQNHAFPINHANAGGRAVLMGTTVHIPDVETEPGYSVLETVQLGRQRAMLSVPLMRQGDAVGVITLSRAEPRPFTERQIGLIETFADQAVIAMENARLLSELRESLEQQTATSEVLKTISRSSVGLEAVLQTLVETVSRLCRADLAYMFRQEDELYHLVAAHGLSEEARAFVVNHPIAAEDRRTVSGRVAVERRTVHIADVLEDPGYSYGGQQTAGYRTMLGIPLLRESTLIGIFNVARTRVEPFTPKEIELAASFADQAVIAIENARLFEELRDRQAELRVTFDNMGDGVAMFDAEPRLAAWNRNFEEIIGLPEALLAERPSYADYLRLLAERGEFGTENVEAELASRLENTDRELRLERTRADGTVIEVRRNAVPGGGFVLIYSDVTEQRRAEAAIRAARDAAEAALERQTATADILKVIASSPADTQPAFDAIAQSANRLLEGRSTTVWRFDGDKAFLESFTPISPEADEALKTVSPTLVTDRPHLVELRRGQVVHISDTEKSAAGRLREIGRLRGFRAQLFVPLLAQGKAIGFISVTRKEASAFDPDDIQLLQTFADQAVIAIQNARLFTDLSESLEQQTATAEILRAISQSPTDVKPVLEAVVKAALRFCSATDAMIQLREGDSVISTAHEGPLTYSAGARRSLDRTTAGGRSIVDAQTCHLPDVEALEAAEFVTARKMATQQGFRASVAAPLKREGAAIGAVVLRKVEPGPFTPQQILLLETFAAQAVIAIENVRLFTELRDSLERLKAAQANLIQAEKMASLGQLTAGIAHEIKNPLNFVNNFAGLSSELLDELKQAVDALLAEPDENKRAELQDTMDLLTGNLAKIVEHGRRADGIVKSMLSHSRGGRGDWQESNINALVEEALNLAYHGARAQDGDFNVTLEQDFAPEAKLIEVVPQDVTRVFLNLFGNGFYATRKRHLGGTDAGYRPTLKVSTRDLGDAVEVRVRDNGTGIQPEVHAKLFQPFFTTKPTGEGTGLGLSISYDIVTQQHSGSIDVESEPGSFTEFTVRLPRRRRAV